MSGGVDSSVAAGLLRRAGYRVIGVFMRLGSADGPAQPIESDADDRREGHRGCCSVGDAADARLVAAELGIPLYVCNFRRSFERVIDYFVEEYASGRTPNPCIRCNDWLKFGRLFEDAERLGAQWVATGHYARVVHRGRPRLLRAVDEAKDQSYVLFGVRRERLSRMRLPIGEYRKADVRELARRFGLPVFDKAESQEICFVPAGGYARLVESRRPALAAPGAILDESGRVVGAHAGQHRYTIGQRRIGVALGRPVYVIDKDASANTITVGAAERLRAVGCEAVGVNWLVRPRRRWWPCHVRYRAHGELVPALVRAGGDGADTTRDDHEPTTIEVRFLQPQTAVAPGQAIVCYRGEAVICGGWIERALRADAAVDRVRSV